MHYTYFTTPIWLTYHLSLRAVPEINLWGGGVDGKNFFQWVKVRSITDFRRLGGE